MVICSRQGHCYGHEPYSISLRTMVSVAVRGAGQQSCETAKLQDLCERYICQAKHACRSTSIAGTTLCQNTPRWPHSSHPSCAEGSRSRHLAASRLLRLTWCAPDDGINYEIPEPDKFHEDPVLEQRVAAGAAAV